MFFDNHNEAHASLVTKITTKGFIKIFKEKTGVEAYVHPKFCSRILMPLILFYASLYPSLAQATDEASTLPRKVCDVAYYGLQAPGWPCQASIDGLAACTEIKVAFLANTFIPNPQNPGYDPNACLARLLKDSRTSAVEIHLINERCQERPGGCTSNEFMFNLPMSAFNRGLKIRDPYMMQRVGLFFTQQAGKIFPLLRPETVCWVSPVLESRLEQTSFQTIAELAHWQFFQRCHVVQNSLQNNGSPYINEAHGNAPRLNPPCIADLDGVDIALDLADNNYEHKRLYGKHISEAVARTYINTYNKCGARFAWIGEFNGRGPRFDTPPNRHNWPTLEIFRRVASLFPTW